MLVGADQFFGNAQKAADGQKAAGDAGPQLSQADIEAILQSAFAGKGNPVRTPPFRQRDEPHAPRRRLRTQGRNLP